MNQIYRLIDEVNEKDPRIVDSDRGMLPKELLYGKRMTEVLEEYAPESSDIIKIACRGQHIERWKIPRNQYPMTKAGYHKWRTTLNEFHQKRIEEILIEVNFPPEKIEEIQQCMNKKNLSTNTNTQILEDVACLVFLKYEFEDFIKQHEDEKVVQIVKKTWKKMSDRAHTFVHGLTFSERGQALIKQALS